MEAPGIKLQLRILQMKFYSRKGALKCRDGTIIKRDGTGIGEKNGTGTCEQSC